MSRTENNIDALRRAGLSYDHAIALRRISMTLHRWHELECGTDRGAIERDETTGKTYWLDARHDMRWPTPDRETGARKRLAKIMAHYDGTEGRMSFHAYIQGDPRGCALYIIRPGDVPLGGHVESYYNRGIAVY